MGSNSSILLSLALFIILLAFFIVLNAISRIAPDKSEKVFQSIDLAFSTDIIRESRPEKTEDEREDDGQGAGDSLESMQDMLTSLLPGLDITLTDLNRRGQAMVVRMEKDKFERLQDRLIPIFIRILNIKDGEQAYHLSITSNVRDITSAAAVKSFDVIKGYYDRLVEKGLSKNRIGLRIQQENPAFLEFRFDKKL